MSSVATERPTVDLDAVPAIRLRWIAISVFILSDTLNFLDRQLLAAVAPSLKGEFHLSNAGYGLVLSAFAMVYLVFAPITGFLVDRFGFRRSIMVGVTAWSLAGLMTGFAQSFRGLLACRMTLGFAETAGIPCASKASASYLKPRELGIGIAFNSLGFTLGAVFAPLIAAAIVPVYGWRAAFLACGLFGLVWVPIWWFTSRQIPAREETSAASAIPFRSMIADRRLWVLACANILIMTLHSLWFNWTTIYFVEVHGLTPLQANQYFAWIPPIFGTVGGFFGGWLGLRWIRSSTEPVAARIRVCTVAAPFLLMTAIIPFIHSTRWAAVAISLNFFLVMAILSNLHVIPIHLFGVRHAAFTAAMLAFSYSLLQVVFSPIVGAMVDTIGFPAVCFSIAALPMIGVFWVRSINK